MYCIYIISVQPKNPDASHKEAAKGKHWEMVLKLHKWSDKNFTE